MSQEPINIAGVCAFPNPNGVRDMRFVDYNYNTLFLLPNHSSIIMTKPDGTQMKHQCSYIDDYHIYIGQCGFHIMEFAEMAWRNGYTYLPEYPRAQDCCDTYALYQIKDVIRTDYFCCAYRDLMMQKETMAHDIALALELFTTGTLNVFAHQTNINSENRLLCFDIQDLGENLKPVGLLVMLDAIFNRVIRNRQRGRYTHVYIDEIYLFFSNGSGRGQSNINQYSSEFLYKCWKRFRKYGAMLTGITQNVEECLRSETAKLMFANSEFLLMFNQAASDRMELAKLLGTSDTQMDHVNNAPAGHGLIKVGGAIVPFINDFPKDTELYRLMSTRPGEG